MGNKMDFGAQHLTSVTNNKKRQAPNKNDSTSLHIKQLKIHKYYNRYGILPWKRFIQVDASRVATVSYCEVAGGGLSEIQ